MNYSELVVAISKDTGEPRYRVARVIQGFMEVAHRALMSGDEVKLRSFGTFYPLVLKERSLFGGTRQLTNRVAIKFKESRAMEKYGVQIDDEKVKTAEERPSTECPDCKTLLRPSEETGVLFCPKCGTQPFEQKP